MAFGSRPASWNDWKPGQALFLVGYEVEPSGKRLWSLSPSPSHAGWLPHINEDGTAPYNMPEEAARALLEAYQFAHRFGKTP